MWLLDALLYAVAGTGIHLLCQRYYSVAILHGRSPPKTGELFVVGHAFSGTLTCGLSMLLLLLLEVMGVTGHVSRAMLWRVLLWTTIFSLVFLVPFLLPFYSFRRRRYGVTLSAIMASLCVWAFLTAFWMGLRTLPINGVHQKDVQGFQTGRHRTLVDELADLPHGGADLMTELISRLAVFGVACMAVLSGFGAVNFPISCLLPLLKPVTRDILRDQKQRLKAAQSLLVARDRDREDITFPRFSLGPSERSRQLAPSRNGHRRPPRHAEDTELRMLRRLCVDLKDELEETREAYNIRKRSRTLSGKFVTLMGWILSMYCIVRMLVAVKTVTTGIITNAEREFGSRPDLGQQQGEEAQQGVSYFVMEFAEQAIGLGHNRRGWFRVVSFALIGMLMSLQARAFLIAVHKISRAGMKTLSTTTSALLITEVAGSFFIAVVMMLRVELPRRLRETVTMALGGANGRIHFDFYNAWFDSIFLLSALLSAALLYSIHESRVTTWTLTDCTVSLGSNPDDADLEAQYYLGESPLLRSRASSTSSYYSPRSRAESESNGPGSLFERHATVDSSARDSLLDVGTIPQMTRPCATYLERLLYVDDSEVNAIPP